jgi:hypothetical protein
MLTSHHKYGHSLGDVGYVLVFRVDEAIIVKGDSLSEGLQTLVSPYSEAQSSYSSSFSSSSLSSHQLQSHHQQGRAIEVTIQLPQISATGDGRFSHIFCGHTQIAIQTCAVRVGATYILIIDGYVPHCARRKLSDAVEFNHQGIGIGQNGV